MNKTQLLNILEVSIITTIVVMVFESIFSIPIVNEYFAKIIKNSGTWFFLILWIIMFLQVTVLNIPAYTVLSATVSIGVETMSWQFILTVLSAYMTGCVLAYWLGRWFGVRAVKWCAGSEEDYNKWSNVLNEKGKIWYFLTIVFPFFPDDLLCIVAGSVKFNFWVYIIENIIGRGIGLITMLFSLKFINKSSGGFPLLLIAWCICLIAEMFIYIYLKRKKNENRDN